jgi:hypothetical protein
MSRIIKVENSKHALEKLNNISLKNSHIDFDATNNRVTINGSRSRIKYQLNIINDSAINCKRVLTTFEKTELAFLLVFFLVLSITLLCLDFSLQVFGFCVLLFAFVLFMEFVFNDVTSLWELKAIIKSEKWNI